jgi:hypothetical protein
MDCLAPEAGRRPRWLREVERDGAIPVREGERVADRRFGGISLGGIIVIVGIIVMFFGSILLGLLITLVGLIAFGGFVRGRWY